MKTRAPSLLALLGLLAPLASLVCVAACSSSDDSARGDTPDARPPLDLGDDADPGDASTDGGFYDVTEPDASKPLVDGGYLLPDGGVVRADRFATTVVTFTPGACAGFGATAMPGVVMGPPVGGGAIAGGLDVVSLGYRGEIVLSVGPNAIVDGPGVDLLVFENAFRYGPNDLSFAELGEVSVSDDGTTWKTFPCDAAAAGPTHGTCAGWRPVLSAPGNGLSPVDPAAAGGDPFDLADVGLARARFVRIRDLAPDGACPANPASRTNNVGFDLDGIAVVNAETP